MHWASIGFSGLGTGGLLAVGTVITRRILRATKSRRDEDRRMRDAILGKAEILDRSGNIETPGQPGLVAMVADLQQEWPKNGTRAHAKLERVIQQQRETEALIRNHISNSDMTHAAIWAALLGGNND